MLYELFSYLTYYNVTYFKKFDFALGNLERDQPDMFKFFDSRMENVELVRNKVERIYFVRPRACDIYVQSSRSHPRWLSQHVTLGYGRSSRPYYTGVLLINMLLLDDAMRTSKNRTACTRTQ